MIVTNKELAQRLDDLENKTELMRAHVLTQDLTPLPC